VHSVRLRAHQLSGVVIHLCHLIQSNQLEIFKKEASPVHLNHKQISVLALTFAAVVTMVILHNPFNGYANSTSWTSTGGKNEWQSSRNGCTIELKQELNSLENAELTRISKIAEGEVDPDSRSTLQRLANSLTSKRAQINRQCMKYVENPPVYRHTPFLEWESDGAYLGAIARIEILLISITSIFIWGIVIIFIFRTPKDGLNKST
jgi:hypothetical protein